MNRQTEWALSILGQWRDRLDNGEGRDIATAIVDWTRDAFAHEKGATAKDVLRHLETTDCAATHAPRGLIYNYDIAAKVPEWYSGIDAALYAYQDETGENWAPRDGAVTVGSLVWFAVEWFAHDAASALQHAMDAAPFEEGR